MVSQFQILKWRPLVLLLACPLAIHAGAKGSSDPPELTRTEEAVSGLLADTPHINSLLVDREVPLLGGRWGGDLFVDVPLNGEPEGANITLRRAKLNYARAFRNNWNMQLSADYTDGGGLAISDTNVSYRGWDRTVLSLGVYDPAFSLESVSSSAGLTFMERSLPVVAISEKKSGGIGVLRRSPNSILDATLVLFNVDRDDHREEGQGFVVHYVHSPVEVGSADSIHLGGSFSYRWNASTEGTLFRSRPEIATINDYFVDTGEIEGAEKIGRMSLEASQVSGRFSWQSELLGTRVVRSTGDDVLFWGAYAYASWFLTNHTRNYDFGTGKFGKLKVAAPVLDGGVGAFEIAARASVVDLTDRDITGGKEFNISLGLNWYLTQRIRLMTNLIKVVDVDRPGSEFDGLDPLILSLRFQLVLD